MGHWGNYRTRYVGDANKNRKRHVHDLANEKLSCAVHSIEWAKNVVTFATKEEALEAGYRPCLFCMPYEPGAD